MERLFVEFPAFTRRLQDEHVNDALVKQLQTEIMVGKGDTIEGTGGLKKIRMSGSGRGKSGGFRVIFADYPRLNVTVLLEVFAKNEKINLNHSEKNEFRKFKSILDRCIEENYG